ncbi:MAG: flagellar biosynthetic protein FliQ [Myxococcales bacterium]|nr:flagellar biosynthetic protein FliQ [Myxococcales bacterium]
MSSDTALILAREGLYLVLILSAPPVVASLVVGVFVGGLQTVTQVKDTAISFAPRAAAAYVALLLAAPWSLRQLVTFTEAIFLSIGQVSGGGP